MKRKGHKNFFVRNGFVKPGELVFDVGCVKGKFTVQFLKAGARVVCIEAHKANADEMQKKFGDKITLVHAALTDRDGRATLFVSQRQPRRATLVPEIYLKQIGKPPDVYDARETVRAVTLESLVNRFGCPVFAKLDIEGNEYAALCGMTTRIPALSFEFASGYIEEAHKCLSMLGRLGYEFNYVDGHHGDFELEKWCSVDKFRFNIPRRNEIGKLTWGNVYARLR